MPILDSDLLITYLRKLPKNPTSIIQNRKQKASIILENLIDDLPEGEKLKTTIFNASELYVGCYRKSMQSGHSIESIQSFLEQFEILQYSDRDVKKFGEIKAKLLDNGKIIGDMDILIASISINNKEILYTNNIDHFLGITELQLKNWMD